MEGSIISIDAIGCQPDIVEKVIDRKVVITLQTFILSLNSIGLWMWAFGEDASRKRTGNSAQNFSILNKIALNLLKNEKAEKQGVKGKRLRAVSDNDYMMKVLKI